MIKDVEEDAVENIKSNLEVQKRRFADQTQVRPSKKRVSIITIIIIITITIITIRSLQVTNNYVILTLLVW